MTKPYANKFDEFQSEAVEGILYEFEKQPSGRFLLVVPTGGGKTITAVKSINAMFQKGILDEHNDRVLWVAHRDYLCEQARESFLKYEEWYPDQASFRDSVKISMVSEAETHVKNDSNIKLIVIDEAHHTAAKSYHPLFDKPDAGVLGLTATPTRHDDKPLDFQYEAYSIGFPDLIDKGVILRPTVRTVETGLKFESVDSFTHAALANLDDETRNNKIVDAIAANVDDYQKVVVYVGEVKHAKNLAKAIQDSNLSNHFESISYIVGEDNSRGLSRDEFLELEKSYKRSLIVNVDILTEGYDDPTVNTVVMARPTRSKLVYMQAMGRAIRHDPDNAAKRAYVLEVVDELPNIRYRIDNRWLYAEICDALEPAVEDRTYSSDEELSSVLTNIYDSFNANEEDRQFFTPTEEERNRYSLLLFKVYNGNNNYRHIPLLIDKFNRVDVSRFYNYLSARIPYYVKKQINSDAIMQPLDKSFSPLLSDKKYQRRVLEAMQNSISEEGFEQELRPWITFVSLRYKKSKAELSKELLDFISEMVNREAIQEAILSRAYSPNSRLVRFPLPFNGFIGRLVDEATFNEVHNVINKLKLIKVEAESNDHRSDCEHILHNSPLPIEHSLAYSLPLIVRDNITYYTEVPE
jgi:superfamily II DNA or RNA helicase